MSHRHQLFVIAKVKFAGDEARYLSLAAIDHSASGSTALYTAFRVLSLVRNPYNAKLIQHELDGISRQTFENFQSGTSPCCVPFITFLLYSATAISLDEPLEGGMLERYCDYHFAKGFGFDPRYNPSQLKNNAGFTIFDITDPVKPCYAFISSGYLTGRVNSLLPFIPSTAEQYICCYFGEAEMEAWGMKEVVKRRVAAINRMGLGLVPLEAMAETWPLDEGFAKALETRGEEEEALVAPTVSHSLPALTATSLNKLVNHAFDEDDPAVFQTGVTQHLLRSSGGTADILKDVIAKRNVTYINNGGLAVLSSLFDLELRASPNSNEPRLLDFSPFPLQAEQVLRVMKSLLSSPDAVSRPVAQMLDVSNLEGISPQLLLTAWKLMPSLTHIVAFGCPLVTQSSIDVLLRSKEAEECSFGVSLRSLQTNSVQLSREELGLDDDDNDLDSENEGEASSNLCSAPPPYRSFVFAHKKDDGSSHHFTFNGKPELLWIGSSHKFFPGAFNILKNIKTWVDYKPKHHPITGFEADNYSAKSIMMVQDPLIENGEANKHLGIGRALIDNTFDISGKELEPESLNPNCWSFIIATPPNAERVYQHCWIVKPEDPNNPPTPWKSGFIRRVKIDKAEKEKKKKDGKFVGNEKEDKRDENKGEFEEQNDYEVEVADVPTFLDAVSPGWKESEPLRSMAEEVEQLLTRDAECSYRDLPWRVMTKEEGARYLREYRDYQWEL